jgi:hypothetical protein
MADTPSQDNQDQKKDTATRRETTPAGSNERVKDQGGLMKSFEKAVLRARLSGYTERIWKRTIPTIGTLSAVFLAASWSGVVWPSMPASMRAAGVILFGAAALASALPLGRVKSPGRREALYRMDKVNAGERAATTYDDIPADEQDMDAQSEAVWRFERRRIEKKVGSFKGGRPDLSLGAKAPLALTLSSAILAGGAFYGAYQQGEVESRLMEAFDWNPGVPYESPARIDAWVKAPDYTRAQPIFIASKDQPERLIARDFNVPSKSVLTLVVHESNVRISKTGGTQSIEEACSSSPNMQMTRCVFNLTSDASVTIQRGGEEPLSWQFQVEQDQPPKVTIKRAEQEQRKQVILDYTIEDEHGADIPEVEISDHPYQNDNPDAKPLPVYNLPRLKIPVQ